MENNRLEAFSDGVLAIIITIMVLELKVPHAAGLPDLKPLLPVFLSYVLSFLYVGIYLHNHHHRLDGRKPSRADAHCGLWVRAADGGERIFHSATHHHCPAGTRLPARGGD